MEAGKLNRRITVERFTSLQDEYGEAIETWSTYAVLWASKKDVSDSERMKAAEVSAEITSRFVVRYSLKSSSINPKDRILIDGKIYDILGVKEIGRRRYLEITAAARADL